jgi:hypothetical protein
MIALPISSMPSTFFSRFSIAIAHVVQSMFLTENTALFAFFSFFSLKYSHAKSVLNLKRSSELLRTVTEPEAARFLN